MRGRLVLFVPESGSNASAERPIVSIRQLQALVDPRAELVRELSLELKLREVRCGGKTAIDTLQQSALLSLAELEADYWRHVLISVETQGKLRLLRREVRLRLCLMSQLRVSQSPPTSMDPACIDTPIDVEIREMMQEVRQSELAMRILEERMFSLEQELAASIVALKRRQEEQEQKLRELFEKNERTLFDAVGGLLGILSDDVSLTRAVRELKSDRCRDIWQCLSSSYALDSIIRLWRRFEDEDELAAARRRASAYADEIGLLRRSTRELAEHDKILAKKQAAENKLRKAKLAGHRRIQPLEPGLADDVVIDDQTLEELAMAKRAKNDEKVAKKFRCAQQKQAAERNANQEFLRRRPEFAAECRAVLAESVRLAGSKFGLREKCKELPGIFAEMEKVVKSLDWFDMEPNKILDVLLAKHRRIVALHKDWLSPVSAESLTATDVSREASFAQGTETQTVGEALVSPIIAASTGASTACASAAAPTTDTTSAAPLPRSSEPSALLQSDSSAPASADPSVPSAGNDLPAGAVALGSKASQDMCRSSEETRRQAPRRDTGPPIHADLFVDIVVKRLSGQCTPLRLKPYDSIDSVKLTIERQLGIPPDKQRLYFDGRQLQEGCKLSDYKIVNNSIVYLTFRERGGGDSAEPAAKFSWRSYATCSPVILLSGAAGTDKNKRDFEQVTQGDHTTANLIVVSSSDPTLSLAMVRSAMNQGVRFISSQAMKHSVRNGALCLDDHFDLKGVDMVEFNKRSVSGIIFSGIFSGSRFDIGAFSSTLEQNQLSMLADIIVLAGGLVVQGGVATTLGVPILFIKNGSDIIRLFQSVLRQHNCFDLENQGDNLDGSTQAPQLNIYPGVQNLSGKKRALEAEERTNDVGEEVGGVFDEAFADGADWEWEIKCDSCNINCSDEFVKIGDAEYCKECAEMLEDVLEAEPVAPSVGKTKNQVKPAAPPFIVDSVTKFTTYTEDYGPTAVEALVKKALPEIENAFKRKHNSAKVVELVQHVLLKALALMLGTIPSTDFKNKCLDEFSFLHESAILPFVQKGDDPLVLLLLRVAKIDVHINDLTGDGGWTAESVRALAAFFKSLGAKLACFNVGVGYSESMDLHHHGGKITYTVKAPERKFGVAILGILIFIANSLKKEIRFCAHTLGNIDIQLKFPFFSKQVALAVKHAGRLPAHKTNSGGVAKDLRPLQLPGVLHLSAAGVGQGQNKAAAPMLIALGGTRALTGLKSGEIYERLVKKACKAAGESMDGLNTASSAVVKTTLSAPVAEIVRTKPDDANKLIVELVATELLRNSPGVKQLQEDLERLQDDCAVAAHVPLPDGLPQEFAGMEVTFMRLDSIDDVEKMAVDNGGQRRNSASDTLSPAGQLAQLHNDLNKKKKVMKPLSKVEVWCYLIVVKDMDGKVIFIYVGSTNNLWRRFVIDRPRDLLTSGSTDGATAKSRVLQSDGFEGTMEVFACSWMVDEGTMLLLGDGHGLMLWCEARLIHTTINLELSVNKRTTALTEAGAFGHDDAVAAGHASIKAQGIAWNAALVAAGEPELLEEDAEHAASVERGRKAIMTQGRAFNALRVAAGLVGLASHAAEYAASFWRYRHGLLPASADLGDERFYDVLQAIYNARERFFEEYGHYDGTFLLAQFCSTPPIPPP